jgi:hypothetical protein
MTAHVYPKSVRTLIIEYTSFADGLKFECELSLSSKCVYTKPLFLSGFGGLGLVCWPLVPKFVGSYPAKAVGFFRAKKSLARLPSEGK